MGGMRQQAAREVHLLGESGFFSIGTSRNSVWTKYRRFERATVVVGCGRVPVLHCRIHTTFDSAAVVRKDREGLISEIAYPFTRAGSGSKRIGVLVIPIKYMEIEL